MKTKLRLRDIKPDRPRYVAWKCVVRLLFPEYKIPFHQFANCDRSRVQTLRSLRRSMGLGMHRYYRGGE